MELIKEKKSPPIEKKEKPIENVIVEKESEKEPERKEDPSPEPHSDLNKKEEEETEIDSIDIMQEEELLKRFAEETDVKIEEKKEDFEIEPIAVKVVSVLDSDIHCDYFGDETESGRNLEEIPSETAKIANSLFRAMKEHFNEIKSVNNSIFPVASGVFLSDNYCMSLMIGQASHSEIRKTIASDRANTAYELSTNHKAKPSSDFLKSTHMSTAQGTIFNYTTSPGGYPIYETEDLKLVGGFSVCVLDSPLDDNNITLQVIARAGYLVSPIIRRQIDIEAENSKVSNKIESIGVWKDVVLVKKFEPEEKVYHWVLKNFSKIANEEQMDCGHKFLNPNDYFLGRSNFPFDICPKCSEKKNRILNDRKEPKISYPNQKTNIIRFSGIKKF